MRVLAIDVGSSSVKAAVLTSAAEPRRLVRLEFPTTTDPVRAEVRAADILDAVRAAVRELDLRRIDVVAMTSMSPSWVAMDKQGRALTPIVTHQDRRSVLEAQEIERRVGKARHLKLAGNRPVPGGISSTTFAWFKQHHPDVIQRADLVGHLSTFLLRRWCGVRVIDPSNASFTGLYNTTTLKGWNAELCEAAGVSLSLLPAVCDANGVAGKLGAQGARDLGLPSGTPVLTGCLDTSAAMLLAGTSAGTMLNVVGTTDVLAMCVDKPLPDERLLTRALGIGKKWMSVSTLASAGSTLEWVRRVFYPQLKPNAFYRQIDAIAARTKASPVRFQPYLAGSRTSLQQHRGGFENLTLASSREEMVGSVLEALATESAARLERIESVNGQRARQPLMVTGGGAQGLIDLMRRHWRKGMRFNVQPEATLRGLYELAAIRVER